MLSLMLRSAGWPAARGVGARRGRRRPGRARGDPRLVRRGRALVPGRVPDRGAAPLALAGDVAARRRAPRGPGHGRGWTCGAPGGRELGPRPGPHPGPRPHARRASGTAGSPGPRTGSPAPGSWWPCPSSPPFGLSTSGPTTPGVVRDDARASHRASAVRRGPVTIISVSVGLGPVALALDAPPAGGARPPPPGARGLRRRRASSSGTSRPARTPSARAPAGRPSIRPSPPASSHATRTSCPIRAIAPSSWTSSPGAPHRRRAGAGRARDPGPAPEPRPGTRGCPPRRPAPRDTPAPRHALPGAASRTRPSPAPPRPRPG